MTRDKSNVRVILTPRIYADMPGYGDLQAKEAGALVEWLEANGFGDRFRIETERQQVVVCEYCGAPWRPDPKTNMPTCCPKALDEFLNSRQAGGQP